MKDIKIQDPLNLLTQIDQFVGDNSFSQTYSCHQRARYFASVQKATLSCGEDGCGAIYESIDDAEGDVLTKE